eukprot:2353-Heterococcus_DN1.PRE.1
MFSAVSSAYGWLTGSAAEPSTPQKRARDEDEDEEDEEDAAAFVQLPKKTRVVEDVAPAAQTESKSISNEEPKKKKKNKKQTFKGLMGEADTRSNILEFLTLKEKTKVLMTGKAMRNIMSDSHLWDTLVVDLWNHTNGKRLYWLFHRFR